MGIRPTRSTRELEEPYRLSHVIGPSPTCLPCLSPTFREPPPKSLFRTGAPVAGPRRCPAGACYGARAHAALRGLPTRETWRYSRGFYVRSGWSPNSEKRRKVLVFYFSLDLALINRGFDLHLIGLVPGTAVSLWLGQCCVF